MVKGAESGGPVNGPGSKPGTSVEVSGGRVRFVVELNPGETTVVSWKKLLKEANLSEPEWPGPSASGPSLEARGDEPLTPPAAAFHMIETGSRDEEDLLLYNMPDEEDYDTDDSFIDDYFQKESLVHMMEGSSVRPNIKNLENAFGELENIVEQFRPPSDPVNQSHSGKKRLPPKIKLEIAKVARIAGSCYEQQIPKEVIDRLMSILGHLMEITTLERNIRAMANAVLSAKQENCDQIQKMKQEVAEMVKSRTTATGMKLKRLEDDSGPAVKRQYMKRRSYKKVNYVSRPSLALLWFGGFMNTNRIKRAIFSFRKRNLRAMANAGLSTKQAKYDIMQKMKQEVDEMVKLWAAGKKQKHSFDNVLENKICKLYDLYVETLEVFSGPERLHEELALLWPGGFMNTNRVKSAIYRAKERKGIRSFRKDREKIKKKNILPQDASNNAHGTNSHLKLMCCDLSSKLSSSIARSPVTSNSLNPGNPMQEK